MKNKKGKKGELKQVSYGTFVKGIFLRCLFIAVFAFGILYFWYGKASFIKAFPQIAAAAVMFSLSYFGFAIYLYNKKRNK